MKGKIGKVLEVKLDDKGNSPNKLGKAKILPDLLSPLKFGTIMDSGYKKLWMYFRYERFLYFCYSYE